MPRSASILTLDAQEHDRDTIPRSMPCGLPATQGERIKISELYSKPFFKRVNDAVEQLKNGHNHSDVRDEHGIIVFREAIEKLDDVDPLTGVSTDERQRGRPKIIVPCRWCGKLFDGRGMQVHKISCEMKPRRH